MRKRLWVVMKDGAVNGEWLEPAEAEQELERVTDQLNAARMGGNQFVRIGKTATVNADVVVSITLDEESHDTHW